MDKSKPKSGVDILLAMGGPKKPPSREMVTKDEDDTEDDADDSGLPPDFEQAYADYKEHPSAQALWDVIEMCKGASKDDDKGY